MRPLRRGPAAAPADARAGRAVRRAGAQLAGLAGFVDTTVWDLARATFETRAELRAYCARWSAAFVEPLARHAAPQLAPEHAQRLGRTLRELELLLALAADARLGRLRLPLDELAAAQVPPESLAQPPWNAALRRGWCRPATASCVPSSPPRWLRSLRRRRRRSAGSWCGPGSPLRTRGAPRGTCRTPAAPRDHLPLDGWRAWRTARRAQANRLRLA